MRSTRLSPVRLPGNASWSTHDRQPRTLRPVVSSPISVRWPPVIEYARLRPGRGFSPAQALLYYIQRLITPFWIRKGIANLVASILSIRHPSPAPATVQQELRQRLEQKGLIALPA